MPYLATGLLLASAGSIAFSGKAIIVKLAYRHGVDAVTLIMYRMLFALPLFLALAWWATYRQGGGGKAALTRQDWLGILGLGFTGYYLASFLDFWGLQYISASLERLILYLNPTLVLLLGWVVYQRRITRLQALAMAVSYAGVPAPTRCWVRRWCLAAPSATPCTSCTAVNWSSAWAPCGWWAWPPAWPVRCACCNLCCCAR
jgi:drug/metabolite transporter (DMT)-like permease